MDDNLGYLFAAFAITWLGIAAYLFYVNQQVRGLHDEVQALNDRAEEPSTSRSDL